MDQKGGNSVRGNRNLSEISIQYANLHIRALKGGDVPEFYLFVQASQKRLEDYFPITLKANQSLDASKRYISAKLNEALNGSFVLLGIWSCDKNILCGIIALKQLDWRIPKCEIAYYNDKANEGKALMTSALKAVIKHLFGELKFKRLYVRIAEKNIRSLSLAARCGFQKEGQLRNDHILHDGTLCDNWLMAVIN